MLAIFQAPCIMGSPILILGGSGVEILKRSDEIICRHGYMVCQSNRWDGGGGGNKLYRVAYFFFVCSRHIAFETSVMMWS